MKTEILPAKDGNKPITFHKNGLHQSLGVPAGTKIPAAKRSAALQGKFGKTALKQALFAKNVLKH